MFDKLETLNDLFEMQLKDLYSAETQLVKALLQMAEAAKDGRLRWGFEKHLTETKQQVARLERIGSSLGLNLDGHWTVISVKQWLASSPKARKRCRSMPPKK